MPDSASPDRPGDAATFAYSRIRQAILAGELAPGSVLSQVRVAAEYGISRTPLREGLTRLEGERLITSDFNRRVRISELDLDDLDQIYAIRMALEPVGIRATIGALTPADRERLAASLDQMDAAITIGDLGAFRTSHRRFHLGLTERAGDRITDLLADLWDHSERYRLAYLQYDLNHQGSALAERLHTSQREHRQIMDAALAGEADECARLEVAHLSRTLDGVFADRSQTPARRSSQAGRP